MYTAPRNSAPRRRRRSLLGRTIGGASVAVLAIFVVLPLMFALSLFYGWLLMLLLGSFAGYIGVPGLAIGYWASVVWAFVLRMILTTATTKSED